MIVGYHYLIAQPIDLDVVAEGHWSVRLTVMSTACTIFITHCFYALRVYRLNPRNKKLIIPVIISMIVDSGFAIAAGVEAFRLTPSVADFQRISVRPSCPSHGRCMFIFMTSRGVVASSRVVRVGRNNRHHPGCDSRSRSPTFTHRIQERRLDAC
ncbi:hypothetical protein C8Q77DRAFT_1149196 [Trametes polyzona]|nr:hypothetical protein C8Q77DRAFT_1149196 [Trametes polyzona]